ncbi:hypothetical protein Micbo1qcDRAFT_181346 [Microdochium bolleyi]|uniref:DNA 3'-5' helicase n=1 Tax=Microdochium bolleyi TaxID=196109 RepID=A0A136IIL6_9PEZI|nr:hypothetical protein Micbo1qcDRAFT_181346 [Microdochium bolleyi]
MVIRQHWTGKKSEVDDSHGCYKRSKNNWTAVALQSFSRARQLTRYWIVDTTTPPQRVTTGEETTTRREAESRSAIPDTEWELQLRKYEAKATAKAEERQRMIGEETGVDFESPWVRLDMAELRRAAQPGLTPRELARLGWAVRRGRDEEEAMLVRLGQSFDRTISRCEQRIGQVPVETLCWLASRDPGRPAPQPFELKQEARARERYRAYWRHSASDRGGGLVVPGDMERDEDLDARVFTFCISSLTQQVIVDQFKNPLLHFTAVLTIDPARAKWRAPGEFTGTLAGLEGATEDNSGDGGRLDEVEAEQEGICAEDLNTFRDGYQRWIADGSYSPFSTITRWMTLGKGFRQKEGGIARIMWEDGRRALSYLGQRIEVQEFRDMAQRLVSELETGSDELLYGEGAALLDQVELANIYDSMMFEGRDSSFATNARNAWLQAGPRVVARIVKAELWSQQRIQYHQEKSRQWLGWLTRLKSKLLLATHIWGGQPGRGPEITSVRHCDTKQLARSVDKAKSIRGYGRKIARFLPERVGRLLQGAPSRVGTHIGVDIGMAGYRHVATELGWTIRGLVVQQQKLEIGAADGDYGSDGDEVNEVTGERQDKSRTELIWDLQATYSSTIARAHYAVNIQFPGQLQPEMIANYREISRLWHERGHGQHQQQRRQIHRKGSQSGNSWRRKRLRFDQDEESPTVKKRRRQSTEAVWPGHDADLEEIDSRIQKGLNTIIVQGARWRMDEQQTAMRQVLRLRGGRALIVVLPTGAGKSLLFMIPSVQAVHGGVSIVVVPFVVLIDNIVARARSIGINYMRWRSAEGEERRANTPARLANLVVVSADQASNNEFMTYVDSLRERRLLRRIFIDECHTIITDVGYRERLGRIRELHRFDQPLILLTATLPVKLEGWFRRQMVASDAEIIRASTAKKNISYSVVRVQGGIRPGGVKRKAVENEVVRLVEETAEIQALEGDKKGVIYCRTKKSCEELAGRVGCSYYHSGMEAGERREALERWSNGGSQSRWITATTGLGTGVDIPGICIIIHAERPYGLVDYVQQTGRGGRRDGEVVEAIIVIQDGGEHEGEGEGSWVLLWTEPVGMTAKCSKRFDVTAATGEKEKKKRERKKREKREKKKRERMKEVQGLKKITARPRGTRTGLRRRERRDIGGGADYSSGWRMWKGWSGARHALGQRWYRSEYEELGEEDKCRRNDKVLPVVLLAQKDDIIREIVEEEIGELPKGEEAWQQWIGQPGEVLGSQMTDGLAVWEAVVRRIGD